MNSYKHYIKINKENKIIDFFTSANKQKRDEPDKIQSGIGLRQFPVKIFFPLSLIDENGKENYHWKDGKIQEIPEDDKLTVAEFKEQKKKDLELKYKRQIEDLGIEKYRNPSVISDIFTEYDIKKAEIEKKKSKKTIKEVII